MTLHQRRGGLRAKKLRPQIRVHDSVPLLVGKFLELRSEKHSCIIYKNIEAAELLVYGCEHALHISALRYIRLQRDGSTSQGLNFTRQFLGFGFRSGVVHHYIGAFFGKPQDNTAPDLFRSPRDQSHLPCEQLFCRHLSPRVSSRSLHPLALACIICAASSKIRSAASSVPTPRA